MIDDYWDFETVGQRVGDFIDTHFALPLLDIYYTLRGIPYRIAHVLSWIPVLWDDSDCDFDYTLFILRKKLLDTANTFETDQIGEDYLEVSTQMRKAAESINKYLGSMIEMNDQEDHHWAEIWRIIGTHGRKWWY